MNKTGDSPGGDMNERNYPCPPSERAPLSELAARWLEAKASMIRQKGRMYNQSIDRAPPLFDVPVITGLQARINDKLSRLRGHGVAGTDDEDTLSDLVGYLALYAALR